MDPDGAWIGHWIRTPYIEIERSQSLKRHKQGSNSTRGQLFLVSSTRLLRVDSSTSPPPLSFSLSGSSGGRRDNGLGGWLLLLYIVVVEVDVAFCLRAVVPSWSRTLDSIGRIWCAWCFISIQKLLWWQEWWIGGRLKIGISNNKAVLPSSSLYLAGSSSSVGCSLEMLRGDFCPWWMEWQWCGSEGTSANKLVFPFKKFNLEFAVCVLAAMEVGSAADSDCFCDWSVLEESGGDFCAASSSFFISAAGCCCYADGAAVGRSSSMTSLSPIHQAEGRLLPPSLLAKIGQHKGSINLRFRRPCYLVVVSSRCGDPSGLVPGVSVVGHGAVRRRGEYGAGPDRVFRCNSEVRGAKHKDFVVISFSCEVLFMYCNAFARNQ
jgi:hypothetical protein